MTTQRGNGRKRAVGPMIVLALLGALFAAAPSVAAASADYEPGPCIDNDGLAPETFDDVNPGAFYYDAVRWGFHNLVVAGFDENTFGPGANVTRAEFAAFLHRMACFPTPAGVAGFDDLEPGAFYRTAVDWMVGAGITEGKTETTFGPHDPMTRGEFAAFLFRFIGSPAGAPFAPFADIDRAAFFAAAVDWLLFNSVTQGTSATTFSPWSHITRGEVVAFLHRLNTIADVALRLEPVATRTSPTAAATDPSNGAVFVTERSGRVFRYPAGADGRPDWSAGTEVLDLSGPIGLSGEGGLLSVAVAPDGGALYLSYTDNGGDSVIRRYPLAGGFPTGAPVTVIGPISQPQSNHNGGQIVFGPDGHLFTSFGDGGGGNDDDSGHTAGVGNGQDNGVLLGKILRLAPKPGGGYDIPGDNPLSAPDRTEIWANGVRNPWRFTFDSETGDLWVADVGQDSREEITRLRAADGPTVAGGFGANLGWRLREGEIATPGVGGTAPAGAAEPVHTYAHGVGCFSITGGYVYRGSAIPALWGTYVYGDYCAGDQLRGWRDPAGVEAETFSVSVPGGNLVSFLEDGSGEVYTISLNGTIARLERVVG